jgi:uncharacterized protein
MSRFPDQYNVRGGASYGVRAGQPVSVSTVSFFNAVYAWMASGLVLTALVAWWVSTQDQLVRSIFHPGVLLVLFLVELGLVGVISAATQKINAAVATVLFLIYSALNGLTLSAIFLVYTHQSIYSTFGICAGTFAVMSVVGMVTRIDLTKLGSILFMALIGLIIASLINIFFHSSGLTMIINYAGVLIFVGLTAYDTQKLKYIAAATASDAALSARYSINGALTLYLDFINLFLFLLRILGNRRD